MRTLLFFSLFFALTACNNNDVSHRSSYVISKSHETAAETEVTETPAE